MAKKPAAPLASSHSQRTAVVLIHGIGNQPPMETLRGFVDAVWWRDPRIVASVNRQLWVKPSDQAGDYELRRMTASSGTTGDRTDFFEFYWAHMMEGTRFASVFWWLKRLFWRRLERVPGNAFAPWLAVGFFAMIALLATLFFTACVLQAFRVLMMFKQHGLSHALFWVGVAAAIGVLAWVLRYRVLMQVVGDAARYLTPDPENIAARSRIRGAGVELLQKLQRDPRYSRIVLVGHSLGTVVGYDILTILWGEQLKVLHQGNKAALLAIQAVEAQAARLWNGPSTNQSSSAEPDAAKVARDGLLESFQDSQRAYCDSLKTSTGLGWKITDFVTLGSPLTYSSFLLVDDNLPLHESDRNRTDGTLIEKWLRRTLSSRDFSIAKVFTARAAERTCPLSPPLPDVPGQTSFCYESLEFEKPQQLPHHAAVFAATRWANIYAPPKWLLWGDVISGRLAPFFGPGVRDIALTQKMSKSFVAHVHYWNADKFGTDVEHLETLRQTLDLPA
jgi:hypothetical protein